MLHLRRFRCFHLRCYFQNASRRLRSSPPEVFLRKSVLRKSGKFTGKHPCRSVISAKFLCNFTQIILRHACFPVNFLHIFRTSFPKNTSGEAATEVSYYQYDKQVLKQNPTHGTAQFEASTFSIQFLCNDYRTCYFYYDIGQDENVCRIVTFGKAIHQSL